MDFGHALVLDVAQQADECNHVEAGLVLRQSKRCQRA